MAKYLVGNQRLDSESSDFFSMLAMLHSTKTRPLCLCRDPGCEMYIAKVNNKFILKRMPGTGEGHAPTCDSYEPPEELSGRGQVMGSAIEEDAESGNTKLKFDFSLSKSGHRNMPTPTGNEADTVTTPGNRLTLRGMLHYLWEEAGFNHWTPNMAGKRHWSVIRKYLLEAANNKTAKGTGLGELLYIPETFFLEKKDEIAQRRVSHLSRIAATENGARKLMIVIGEIVKFDKSRYGMKVVLKHLPDYHFQLSEELHKKLHKRFELELSQWGADEQSHLIMIGTFSVNHAMVANLEEVGMINVTDNWIPYEGAYDRLLIDALTHQNRRFVKGLRYNLQKTKPLAVAVLTDMGQESCALFITPAGASQDYVDEQNELIKQSSMNSWVWDASAGTMPALPQPHHQSHAQPAKSSPPPTFAEDIPKPASVPDPAPAPAPVPAPAPAPKPAPQPAEKPAGSAFDRPLFEEE